MPGSTPARPAMSAPLRCPVGIETGTMVIGERARRRTDADRKTAHWVGGHTGAVEAAMKLGRRAQALSRTIIGDGASRRGGRSAARAGAARQCRACRAPCAPGPGAPKTAAANPAAPLGKVVYFPSCATRMFGAPTREHDLLPTTDAMLALLQRAGFDPVVPEHARRPVLRPAVLSQGLSRGSRAGRQAHADKLERLAGGKLPVVTDASTCAKHLRRHRARAGRRSAEFLLAEVLPRLTITRQAAGRRRASQLLGAAAEGAGGDRGPRGGDGRQKVVVLDAVTCCGYAGDKGLFVPELNAHATRFVQGEIPRRLHARRLDRLDLRHRTQRTHGHSVRLARQPAGKVSQPAPEAAGALAGIQPKQRLLELEHDRNHHHGLGQRGDGIAEATAPSVFVPFTLPGEHVDVDTDGERGTLVEVLSPQPRPHRAVLPLFRHLRRLQPAARRPDRLCRVQASAGQRRSSMPTSRPRGADDRRARRRPAARHAACPQARRRLHAGPQPRRARYRCLPDPGAGSPEGGAAHRRRPDRAGRRLRCRLHRDRYRTRSRRQIASGNSSPRRADLCARPTSWRA